MCRVEDRFEMFRNATASALLRGSAATDTALREAVAAGTPPEDLRALVAKIRTRAYTVTDSDLDSLRARYSEDQLFEIIVAAAFGAARDRLAAAHRALEDA
jgi:alkylhydroperoxidase family enzyme